MKLKAFWFAAFASLPFSVLAQPRSTATTGKLAESLIGRTDSVALPKALSNIKITPALPEGGVVSSGRMFVPLAGNKTYFGSMNDYVATFARSYFNAHSKSLAAIKSRSKARFKPIEKVLQTHSIPKELKYLAVIESALNNNAISPVGAVGPWQFMEQTARDMGLTVNEKRDDRTDWSRSTQAAAKYLNQLYARFHDWLLVVAAYNCGHVPVESAIARTGSKNFWVIRKYLARETQGHVLAFVATASIFEKLNHAIGGGFPSTFSFISPSGKENTDVAAASEPPKPQFTREELERMAIVRITEPINLEYMGQELGIERKLLADWNMDYDLFLYEAYSEPYYSLRIPKDKLEEFIVKKELLTRTSRQIFAQNIP
ncbi:MAG: lytic transglycosylase domain-containing protein [Sphingobacteriales bacterium]|nr:MAG: lytic transglycosylase domain-containing protein [Sphingobacteriales bacterium]